MYFDYAATTPILKEALNDVKELADSFANPSSRYQQGFLVKEKIDAVRQNIASLIGASNMENIFFTSGATESNNTVIKGFFNKNWQKRHHYITSSIEHPSVLAPIRYLEKQDKITASYLKPSELANFEGLEQTIYKNRATFLSVMGVNNETGGIFPLRDIAQVAHKQNCFFHSDCTQAISKIDIDVEELNIDAITFSGHKIFSPKGIGILYLKNPSLVEPLLHGGGQEKGIRCGTENVFAILALGQAVEYLLSHRENIKSHYQKCKRYLFALLYKNQIPFHINEANSIDSIASIRFPFIKGDTLADLLDLKYQTMVSIGSACSSNKKEEKEKSILEDIGLNKSQIRQTVRISFGVDTMIEDIEVLVSNIRNIYETYGL